MRKILFRAKRTDNKKWIEGSYIESVVAASPFGYITPSYPTEPTQIYTVTLGQWTGLYDKNGKKIFEGDIVDCWSEGVNAQGEVQQRRDGLWIIYPAWQKHVMWGLCPDEYSHTTVEVIGNIHDNPELIKT